MAKAAAAAWPFGRKPEHERAEALLRAVVAASRAPALYGTGRLSDDIEGRLEAAFIHADLVLIRLKGESGAKAAGQLFTDAFFRWLDSGLYEAGVGYQKVPKEMRALAARFYGRLEAYATAIEAEDEPGLAAALAHNVMRTTPDAWPFSEVLAGYVLDLVKRQSGADWVAMTDLAQWSAVN